MAKLTCGKFLGSFHITIITSNNANYKYVLWNMISAP